MIYKLLFILAGSPAFGLDLDPLRLETFQLGTPGDLMHQVIEGMPEPSEVDFNPIAIEDYRQELEEHKDYIVEALNQDMKRRCDFLNEVDGRVRNNLRSFGYTWKIYETEIAPLIKSELSVCDIESETSPYARIYRRAMSRYDRYIMSYRRLSRACSNSPNCVIG
ncbi:hypothetical protein KUV47_02500 [Vannielia litorea]|uniref:hypothetical protein n=1 Tax=Vannielia litorea TaxID=1217970 RepID=UPI001C97F03E|nr:hypothetical protein [Vannielia litorea]MBY6152071.1 hypothetical protein [Vannielia litorea]